MSGAGGREQGAGGRGDTALAAAIGEPMPVDAPAIERVLRGIWRAAEDEQDGAALGAIRVLNLIVYVEDAANAGLADEVMSLLPARHPCRGIVAEVERGADRPLDATVSARCTIAPDRTRTVCSELITIRAGDESRSLLPDAAMPLLVADLPVVLWWTGRPRPADRVFRGFVEAGVDRVLLDSAAFRDAAAGLLALAQWRRGGHTEAALADLAWERLRPWRSLLAQTVEMDPAGADRAVDRVTIAHGGASPPEEALLAAGWLMASYGWRAEDSPDLGLATLRADAGPIHLRFESAPGPGLRAITLHGAAGTWSSVRADADAPAATCAVGAAGATHAEHRAALAPPPPAALVVAALGRAGRDRVYEAALAAAADLALLGVTA